MCQIDPRKFFTKMWHFLSTTYLNFNKTGTWWFNCQQCISFRLVMAKTTLHKIKRHFRQKSLFHILLCCNNISKIGAKIWCTNHILYKRKKFQLYFTFWIENSFSSNIKGSAFLRYHNTTRDQIKGFKSLCEIKIRIIKKVQSIFFSFFLTRIGYEIFI